MRRGRQSTGTGTHGLGPLTSREKDILSGHCAGRGPECEASGGHSRGIRFAQAETRLPCLCVEHLCRATGGVGKEIATASPSHSPTFTVPSSHPAASWEPSSVNLREKTWHPSPLADEGALRVCSRARSTLAFHAHEITKRCFTCAIVEDCRAKVRLPDTQCKGSSESSRVAVFAGRKGGDWQTGVRA